MGAAKTKPMPTRRADWVGPGDVCVSQFANPPMNGVVLRVDTKLSIPVATVKWESGSTGRHTITTLKVIARAADIAKAGAR